MSLPRKKIYTCTPVAFHANDAFFTRDSGLLSQSLRQLGAESMSIMPLPWYDDDRREDALRVDYALLESEDWWRSLHLDGLILYSWAAPRYRRIARAVHRSGIRLVVHLDSSGNFYNLFPPGTPWWKKLSIKVRGLGQDFLRARHLRYADVITMGSATAEHLRHRLFYGADIADRCYPMSNPVSPVFRYDGLPKRRHVLCIGRWDDAYQKRPEFLMETLSLFYAGGGKADTSIYGTLIPSLLQWHASLPPAVQQQVRLIGQVPNEELKTAYQTAQVLLCPSLYEGSLIVGAEALCCGCSIVVPNRPEDLRCVHWYASRNSGTISRQDTPASLANALQQELELWENGQRDPAAIAAAWQSHFHTDRVLKDLFSL